MKNIINLMLILTVFISSVNGAFASNLDRLIKDSPLDKSSTIAVSVKDVDSGKIIYQYNEKKLLHPASTMKVFTTFPALDVLGKDYQFETIFYVYNNNLYIKLGADPMLSSLNLKETIKLIRAQGYKEFKNIYFDDSVMDNVEWGVGWMWDDGTNPLMQKFSVYNLDNNLINITVSKEANGSPIVKPDSIYKIPVLNAVKVGSSNNACAIRHDWISPEIVCMTGTISGAQTVKVPINNMRRYFESRLFNYLDRSKIKVENKTCMIASVPEKAKVVGKIGHPAFALVDGILKSSNNLYAESLAKIAGGVKTDSQATLVNQLQVFYDYWNNNNVNTTGIVAADASGVSRNNLITADFMTDALISLTKTQGLENMKTFLAQPGEGTMSDRMLNQRGFVFVKTGTLSNISSVTGFIITDNGKTYSFAILIQNFIYPMAQVKAFENQIIEVIKKM